MCPSFHNLLIVRRLLFTEDGGSSENLGCLQPHCVFQFTGTQNASAKVIYQILLVFECPK